VTSPADRRGNGRRAVALQAELSAGPGWFKRGLITDISDDGAFAQVPPTVGPGTRLTVRFSHPDVARMITTKAVVARRIMPGAPSGEEPGLGLYFLEGLNTMGGERRTGARQKVDIRCHLEIAGAGVLCRMVDLADTGGTMELDLGFKRIEGANATPEGRAMTVGMKVRSGVAVKLKFVDPVTQRPAVLTGVVARNPVPLGPGRPEYRFGISFDKPMTSWRAGRRRSLSAPSPNQARISQSVDLDFLATQELELRSLLRGVEWHGRHGGGYGRVVLAGPRRLLVAVEGTLPTETTTVRVVMLTPEDSNASPMALHVEVAQSSQTIVGGRDPGFVGVIRGFVDPRDELRYRHLVEWMVKRQTGSTQRVG
jgi:hypothetical protein